MQLFKKKLFYIREQMESKSSLDTKNILYKYNITFYNYYYFKIVTTKISLNLQIFCTLDV